MVKRVFPMLPLLLVLPAVVCFVSFADAGPVSVADYSGPIRVACIGDSITFGAGIRDRAKNSYPVQLGKMLGQKWEVRNFGVSGATLLKKGDKPYWKQRAWKAALDFKPHIVVIKLGTNDTKPQNWKSQGEFVADYKDMIKTLSGQDPKPRIWICKPVPAYATRWGINDKTITEGVIPKAEQVAKETGAEVIDLYKPLSGKAKLFPDKIHPNAEGAGLMAAEIYKVLTGKQPPTKTPPGKKAPSRPAKDVPATAP